VRCPRLEHGRCVAVTGTKAAQLRPQGRSCSFALEHPSVLVRAHSSIGLVGGLAPGRCRTSSAPTSIRPAGVAGKGMRVRSLIGAAAGNLFNARSAPTRRHLEHTDSGAGNSTVQNSELLPAAAAAKQCGVIIDVDDGGSASTLTVCDAAIAEHAAGQISSDIHSVSLNAPGSRGRRG